MPQEVGEGGLVGEAGSSRGCVFLFFERVVDLGWFGLRWRDGGVVFFFFLERRAVVEWLVENLQATHGHAHVSRQRLAHAGVVQWQEYRDVWLQERKQRNQSSHSPRHNATTRASPTLETRAQTPPLMPKH